MLLSLLLSIWSSHRLFLLPFCFWPPSSFLTVSKFITSNLHHTQHCFLGRLEESKQDQTMARFFKKNASSPDLQRALSEDGGRGQTRERFAMQSQTKKTAGEGGGGGRRLWNAVVTPSLSLRKSQSTKSSRASSVLSSQSSKAASIKSTPSPVSTTIMNTNSFPREVNVSSSSSSSFKKTTLALKRTILPSPHVITQSSDVRQDVGIVNATHLDLTATATTHEKQLRRTLFGPNTETTTPNSRKAVPREDEERRATKQSMQAVVATAAVPVLITPSPPSLKVPNNQGAPGHSVSVDSATWPDDSHMGGQGSTHAVVASRNDRPKRATRASSNNDDSAMFVSASNARETIPSSRPNNVVLEEKKEDDRAIYSSTRQPEQPQQRLKGNNNQLVAKHNRSMEASSWPSSTTFTDSSSATRDLFSVIRCNQDTTTSSGPATSLFYDAFCRFDSSFDSTNHRRKPESSLGQSAASAHGRRPFYDEKFTIDFLRQMMKTGLTVLHFQPPGSSFNNTSEWNGRSVNMVIEPGTVGSNDAIQPKLEWTNIPGGQTFHVMTTSIPLLGIHTIRSKMEEMTNNYGMDEDGNDLTFFTITTTSGDVHIFEANSTMDRDRIVHGIKNVIARLSYHLVAGDTKASSELYTEESKDISRGELPKLAKPNQSMNRLSHSLLD